MTEYERRRLAYCKYLLARGDKPYMNVYTSRGRSLRGTLVPCRQDAVERAKQMVGIKGHDAVLNSRVRIISIKIPVK